MTPVWWILAFVPALIALYFLKLKRQDVAISSTYLWKRSLEDLHVNSPFQRLRQSLLFLLQLLTLLLLIAAVWQPRCDSVQRGGRNLLVLIDRSASMNAREEGGTRLELARKRALALVEDMAASDRMAVRTFASRLETLQPLTNDKAILQAKIRAIQPSSMPTDISDALRAVYSIAETLATVEVYVIGDGCYGELQDVPEEVKRLDLKFINTASALDNIGITEADVRRTLGREKRTEVFALVENFSAVARDLTVSLFRDDTLVRAREIHVPPAGGTPVIFDASNVEPGTVRVVVETEADGLADDDVAFLEIPAPKDVEVWIVSEGNFVVESAVKYIPHVTSRVVSLEEYQKAVSAAEGDGDDAEEDAELASVFIFDRVAPKEVPPAPAIFIGCRPPAIPQGASGGLFPVPKMIERPLVIDSDLGHPVNYMLDYADLAVKESWVFEPSERLHPLVEAEDGAVIATTTYRRAGKFPIQALFVGFDVLESNWPINNPSFPIFFVNAVNWLGAGESESRPRWRSGEILVHRLEDEKSAAIAADLLAKDPAGGQQPAVLERGGVVVLGTAERTGVYRLLAADEELRRFCVSLLSASESRLTPLEAVELGDITIRTETQLEDEATDIWMWLALAGLGIMLLEWYVYNRRMYV